MIRLRYVLSALLAAGTATAAYAQGQVPPPTPQASAPPAIRIGSRVGESPTTYDDGGRRDPFVSLIVPKVAPAAGAASSSARPIAGLGGLSVSDVAVKGLVRSGSTLIALLQGPDGKTYMAKRLDRLHDGVVTRIESDCVVFTERTADAAGVVRARDVRKPLRPAVSGGE
jgi:Tfp pilus assembly protein PilP